MKTMLLSVIILCAIALSVTAQENNTRVFQLSFLSPLGTNGLNSHLVTNKVSFNILGGHSYGNTAFEFGALYNANIHLTKGVQFAGIVNYSGQSHHAVQIAGIINMAAKGMVGAQIAGVVNTANRVKGAQIAGVGNVTLQGSVAAQIGTVFNWARQVKGVQIGLINYADSCDGVQVGLINIVKHGGKHELEVSFSEALNTAVSFKLGTNKLYTIFSVGINYVNAPVQYAYGVGVGAHQNWGRKWGSQIEVIGYQLSEEGEFKGGLDLLGQFKFMVSKQITNHFKVFFGPVLNMTISNYVNPKTEKIGSSLAPYTIWTQTNDKTNLKAWVGFTAGVRF